MRVAAVDADYIQRSLSNQPVLKHSRTVHWKRRCPGGGEGKRKRERGTQTLTEAVVK